MKKILAVAVLFALAVMFVPNANAQLQSSATVGVTVNVAINSTITLTQTGGNLVINPATGNSNTVTFTANWNLQGTTSIKFYTWFQTPTAALSAGSTNIPSSAIQESLVVPGIATMSNFCNLSPGVGNGVVDGGACPSASLIDVGNLNPSGANQGSGTANVSLSIPGLVGLRLPAGNFQGVLNAVVLAV